MALTGRCGSSVCEDTLSWHKCYTLVMKGHAVQQRVHPNKRQNPWLDVSGNPKYVTLISWFMCV